MNCCDRPTWPKRFRPVAYLFHPLLARARTTPCTLTVSLTPCCSDRNSYFTLLNRASRPTWPKRFRHVAQLFHFLFFPLPPELLVPLGQLTWTEERNAAQDPGHLLLFLWKIADIPTPSTAKPSGPARVLASLVPYPRPCATFIPQLVRFLMLLFYVALPIRLG